MSFAPSAHAHNPHVNPDNRPRRATISRPERWQLRYEQLLRAQAELGRLLRRGDPVPPGLVDWMKNQRRNPALTDEQARLLERIPGLTWEPKDDAFEERAEALRLYIAEHRREPRRRSANADERALAEWLGRQRRRASRGQLNAERLRLLTYATGGSSVR